MIAAIQKAAPVLADTPGVSPTRFPQSLNPHPTEPCGPDHEHAVLHADQPE
jgi:hypothetical protein